MNPVPKYRNTRPIQGFSLLEKLGLFNIKSTYSFGAKSRKAEGADNVNKTEGWNFKTAII